MKQSAFLWALLLALLHASLADKELSVVPAPVQGVSVKDCFTSQPTPFEQTKTTVCLNDQVTQVSDHDGVTSSSVSLGTFSKLTGDVAVFKNGDPCDSQPGQRMSSSVTMMCGTKSSVDNVVVDGCQYIIDVTTPSICDPSTLSPVKVPASPKPSPPKPVPSPVVVPSPIPASPDLIATSTKPKAVGGATAPLPPTDEAEPPVAVPVTPATRTVDFAPANPEPAATAEGTHTTAAKGKVPGEKEKEKKKELTKDNAVVAAIVIGPMFVVTTILCWGALFMWRRIKEKENHDPSLTDPFSTIDNPLHRTGTGKSAAGNDIPPLPTAKSTGGGSNWV